MRSKAAVFVFFRREAGLLPDSVNIGAAAASILFDFTHFVGRGLMSAQNSCELFAHNVQNGSEGDSESSSNATVQTAESEY